MNTKIPDQKMSVGVHPVRVDRDPRRLRVLWNGQAVADSTRVISLREASYPAVAYFPREDVSMSLLKPSNRRTRCPHKGEASYFSLIGLGETARDAVWSYEQPLAAVAAIRGYVAFDTSAATIEEVR